MESRQSASAPPAREADVARWARPTAFGPVRVQLADVVIVLLVKGGVYRALAAVE